MIFSGLRLETNVPLSGAIYIKVVYTVGKDSEPIVQVWYVDKLIVEYPVSAWNELVKSVDKEVQRIYLALERLKTDE